jgi:hypothetical protein
MPVNRNRIKSALMDLLQNRCNFYRQNRVHIRINTTCDSYDVQFTGFNCPLYSRANNMLHVVDR